MQGRTVGRKSFDIRVTARIPPTAVRVRPGVTEELKHGWIQYVSFLVITVVAGEAGHAAGGGASGGHHRGSAAWLSGFPSPIPSLWPLPSTSRSSAASRPLLVRVAVRVLVCAAAWVLRKLVFGLHIVETAIFADTPRAKLHLE